MTQSTRSVRHAVARELARRRSGVSINKQCSKQFEQRDHI